MQVFSWAKFDICTFGMRAGFSFGWLGWFGGMGGMVFRGQILDFAILGIGDWVTEFGGAEDGVLSTNTEG